MKTELDPTNKVLHVTENAYGAAPFESFKSRAVGLEIEVEGVGPSATTAVVAKQDFWTITPDHSLRDGGIEFLSRPTATEDLEAPLVYLYSNWAKYGWKSSARTGIHVHVDARDYTLEELRSLLTAYCLVERALFSYVGPEREEGIYCIPWYRAPNELDSLISGLSSGSLLNFVRNYCRYVSKYSAFYLEPLRRFGTVEFRHAPTFKDPTSVLKWAKACAHLLDFSKKRSARQMVNAWSNSPMAFARLALGDSFPVLYSYPDEVAYYDCDFFAMKVAGMDIDDRDWKRVEESLPKEVISKAKKKKKSTKQTTVVLSNLLYNNSQLSSSPAFFTTAPTEEVQQASPVPEYDAYYIDDDEDEEPPAEDDYL